MKVSKLYIHEFKGIPIYISYFVIFRNRRPLTRSYSLNLVVEPLGGAHTKVMTLTNQFDLSTFIDASKITMEIARKMERKYREKQRLN